MPLTHLPAGMSFTEYCSPTLIWILSSSTLFLKVVHYSSTSSITPKFYVKGFLQTSLPVDRGSEVIVPVTAKEMLEHHHLPPRATQPQSIPGISNGKRTPMKDDLVLDEYSIQSKTTILLGSSASGRFCPRFHVANFHEFARHA